MLPSLLMTAVLLTQPSPDDVAAAREAGAEVLWATLERQDDQGDGAGRWASLVAGAEAAARALEHSSLADDVRALLERARSDAAAAGAGEAGGAAGEAAAADALRDGLRHVLADLTFEPILEAALPEGFPAPTPVGEVALKQYPLYRLAKAGSSGGNGAFWQLFNHIKTHDIPMTAPVEMTYDDAGSEVEMAFMYEHPRQGQVGPDGPVEVADVPPLLVASLGCRGWSSSAAVDRAVSRLSDWIAARDDLEIAGPLRRLGYNGPSVMGDRRYYEVQFPVRVVAVEVPDAEASGEVAGEVDAPAARETRVVEATRGREGGAAGESAQD